MADLAAKHIEPKSGLSYEDLWSERKHDILAKQKLWPVKFEWPQGVKASNSV